jgi:hypothetical protein
MYSSRPCPLKKSSERNLARRMDRTSLQLFVALFALGSIGKTAQREFIAVSAVSKRLSDLEATLGTAMLCRHPRGVGEMPQRAFELMNGVGELALMELLDDWALRHSDLVARDFSTLPVTARLLIGHLSADQDA